MKKALILIILYTFFTQLAFGECKWSTIKKNGLIYEYTAECNQQVGQLVQDGKLRLKQIDLLTESLKFKDEALYKTEQRVELWRDTSFKLQDRLRLQHTWGSYDNWLYFVGGVALTVLSVWAAGKIRVEK